MHSRIFYYARIRGVTIPHAPYRAWLRRRLLSSSSSRSRADQSSSSPPLPRIWEWDLLTALCNHRDRLAGASQSPSPSPGAAAAAADLQARDAAAAAERDLWMRELLGAGSSGDDAAEPTPAWMAAAPRGDLYVDPSDAAAGAETGAGGQVPYPDQFAAIIKAVQSGERIEGIVEIPDVVVRNPVRLLPFIPVASRSLSQTSNNWRACRRLADVDRPPPLSARWRGRGSRGRLPKTCMVIAPRMGTGTVCRIAWTTRSRIKKMLSLRAEVRCQGTWEHVRSTDIPTFLLTMVTETGSVVFYPHCIVTMNEPYSLHPKERRLVDGRVTAFDR